MNLVTLKFSFLHYIRKLYYLLIFLTPLVMNSATSEIFEFNKMIFIYLITIVVSFLYIGHIVVQPEKKVNSFFTVVLLLFLSSQILSTFYSIDVLTSVFGYYGRWNGGLVSIGAYILLFYVFIQSFTKESAITFLKVSLLSSTVVIIWGLLATVGYDFTCLIFTGSLTDSCWTAQFDPTVRMFSTIGQPNWLGAYLAFHFFIGVYFLLAQQSFRTALANRNLFVTMKRMFQQLQNDKVVLQSTVLYAGYLVLNSIALFLTKSRSSLLALGVSVLLGAFIFVFKKYVVKKRTEEIAMILFALGIFTAFFIGWRTGFIQNFFALPTQTTAVTDSFDIRKVVWKGAIDLGVKYPYFGTGVETFAYSYYFTRPAAHNLTSEWDFIYNKAHNEYLNYFATTGFVGVSMYLIMILSVFILFWRYYERDETKMKTEKDTLLVTSLLLGYITILITNFFGFSVSTIQLLFYLTPAVVIAIEQRSKDLKLVSLTLLSIRRKFVLSGLVVCLLLSIWYLGNYYSADIDFAKAKLKMNTNDYSEALVLLDSARRKKYEHVYEDKMSYALANLAFLYSFGEEKERASRYMLLADVANIRTLDQAPQNIQYWRTRAKNYYLFYQITGSEEDLQKALVAFEQVTAIAPTDVQSKYTLALFNWIASREVENAEKSALFYGRALEEIRSVIDMKPNYIEAQELLAEMLSGV